MKKVLAVMATIFGVLPLLNVNALTESTNYYTYRKGEVVNFYINEQQETARDQHSGNESIILEDKGANDKFVKVLLTGHPTATSYITFSEGTDKLAEAKQDIITKFRSNSNMEDGENLYFYTLEDPERGLNIPSIEDILDLVGEEHYTVNGDGYTISNFDITSRDGSTPTLFQAFDTIVNGSLASTSLHLIDKGFYLRNIEGNKIAALKFETMPSDDGEGLNVVGASIVWQTVPVTGADAEYGWVVTAYANKTADCHEDTLMCYVCGTNYTYTVVGTQDPTCTAVPNITNPADCVAKACYNCDGSYKWAQEGTQDETVCTKVDNVTSEANCIVSPSTGIESHILEFVIVAALCAIALLVVRRKDLFRTI